MRVLVNDARRQVLSGAVNYFSIRIRKILADGCYLSVLHQYVCIFQPAFFFLCPHSSILYEKVFLFWHFLKPEWCKGECDFPQHHGWSLPGAINAGSSGMIESSCPGKAVSGSISSGTIPGSAIVYTTESCFCCPGTAAFCIAQFYQLAII